MSYNSTYLRYVHELELNETLTITAEPTEYSTQQIYIDNNIDKTDYLPVYITISCIAFLFCICYCCRCFTKEDYQTTSH